VNIHAIYRPFLKFFRTKRMRHFAELFQTAPGTRVLDVGGSEFNWSLLPGLPQLTILNLRPPAWQAIQATRLIADGRHLPFKDGAFDIAYSNSVIEHLGTLENQRLLAKEIRRVARHYYVQTPNKWFPVEPHLLTPFIHWLPGRLQQPLIRNLTVWGLLTRPSRQQCADFMRDIRLLDESELGSLFPGARIWRERVLGLTKSIVAVDVTAHS
jgi:hypothetical protein